MSARARARVRVRVRVLLCARRRARIFFALVYVCRGVCVRVHLCYFPQHLKYLKPWRLLENNIISANLITSFVFPKLSIYTQHRKYLNIRKFHAFEFPLTFFSYIK